ncbi:MAG TPA: hypothetical protein VJV79_29780 [Polyangiaceae bacterium]|nr:hypothetical protein [Polyangiaceae bacterium]
MHPSGTNLGQWRALAFSTLLVAGAFIGCSGQTQSSNGQGTGGEPAIGASAGRTSVGDAGTDADSGLGCNLDADCSVGVCDSTRRECVECRVDASCAKGERCKSGQCVNARPCTIGAYSCDGNTLHQCSPEGELEFSRECAKSEYCDERRAQCEPQVCKPGTASCDGGKVLECNEQGSEALPKQLCSLTQTCVQGECRDISCVPQTTFCNAGDVWECGPDGTTSQLDEHCASQQFCLEKDHTATCSATVCFAGDALCVGNLATSCKPDGSGPKPGGTDCSAAKQLCYSGECRDPVCTPGEKLCDNDDLYICSAAGTDKVLLSSCGTTAACDSVTGACRARICEAGKLSCDGTRVVTCNESGTAFLQSGPDCAASNSLCQAGSCKPIICTPSKYICQGSGTVNVCSADGTTSSFSSNCYVGSHCVDDYYSFGAYCTSYYCQPNAVGCNGNLLTTCKADGSGWVTGGTDCGQTNAVCSSAQCKAKVCTPQARFCGSGNVQQCDSTGLNFYQSQSCSYGTYCRAQGSNAECALMACLPDAPASCAAEKFGVCAADGLSVGTGATDCAVAAKVCTAEGCAPSAVDTLASANLVGSNNYSNNYVYLDVLDVHSSRKLTLLEAYLSLPAQRSLTWTVYQRNPANGYYELKYQKATTGTGTGFQSSGPISFALAAKNVYAVGVSIGGGGYAFYYDSVASPPLLPFAGVVGGINTSFATNLYSNSAYLSTLYSLRLTTTP